MVRSRNHACLTGWPALLSRNSDLPGRLREYPFARPAGTCGATRLLIAGQCGLRSPRGSEAGAHSGLHFEPAGSAPCPVPWAVVVAVLVVQRLSRLARPQSCRLVTVSADHPDVLRLQSRPRDLS